MQTMNRFLISLLLAGALLAQGSPQAVQSLRIDWGKSQRFELERRIEPGAVMALCGSLVEGQAVEWQFVADQAVAFSIYHRIGKQVQYLERRTRTKSLTNRFVPQQATEYCWSWQAPKQAAVQIQLLMRY
jgi:hypothetical protein